MSNNIRINYRETHPSFKLNGIHYPFEALSEIGYSLIKEGEPFEREIGDFLLDWVHQSPTIKLRTSGTTGAPKYIEVNKQAMVNSALATAKYFKLKEQQSALLCLPAQFVAGKMMLVRAMVLGMELDSVPPTTKPTFNTGKVYDFCAMLPMQLRNSLQEIERVKTIIVGGATVSSALETKIQNCSTQVYETYGMTETLTHVAVRPLSIDETHDSFQVLPNISIATDERQCLVIEAPRRLKNKIVTNDIVELTSASTFKWLGRFDNVINSGGLKFYPEQIEKKLASVIDKRFFMTSEKDAVLGERLVLVMEGKEEPSKHLDFSVLDKHEIPKAVYFIPKFSETKNGKIQRQETLEVVR